MLGEGWIGDWHMHTIVYGMDGQWGPGEQHKDVYAIHCDNLLKKSLKKNGYVCAESLCCTAEIIATL